MSEPSPRWGTPGELSPRQMAMLVFIRAHVREHGWAPSLREIGRACEITATSIVSYNLRKLEERGLIQRGGGARQIRVTGQGA